MNGEEQLALSNFLSGGQPIQSSPQSSNNNPVLNTAGSSMSMNSLLGGGGTGNANSGGDAAISALLGGGGAGGGVGAISSLLSGGGSGGGSNPLSSLLSGGGSNNQGFSIGGAIAADILPNASQTGGNISDMASVSNSGGISPLIARTRNGSNNIQRSPNLAVGGQTSPVGKQILEAQNNFLVQPGGAAQFRPTSSPVPLPPASLTEGIFGPVAPNTLFGEATVQLFEDGTVNFADSFDLITESSVRAVCNGTSQLAAILCNEYVINPQGGLLGGLNGNEVSRGCRSTRYGCCPDGTTRKLTQEGSNCSARNDRACGQTAFGCCPGTRIARANLIGTNCPQGAVPLVGWDQNSTLQQKFAAGFGYRDPQFRGTSNEFAAVLPGNISSQRQLEALNEADTTGFGGGPLDGAELAAAVVSNRGNPTSSNNLGFGNSF